MVIPRWRYRLISLSTRSTPSASRPAASPSSATPGPQDQPFSKSFLQQQFPEYYGDEASRRSLPTSGGLAQLVDLFNRLGADGWEYHSREEIAGYSLLIFRQPVMAPPGESSPQQAG